MLIKKLFKPRMNDDYYEDLATLGSYEIILSAAYALLPITGGLMAIPVLLYETKISYMEYDFSGNEPDRIIRFIRKKVDKYIDKKESK